MQNAPVSRSSRNDSPSTPPRAFDVSKNISLVPLFWETEVDLYFGAFEHITNALRWLQEVWAILLQCRLSCKAREVYISLSLEDSRDYFKGKTAILRLYELVREAYNSIFGSSRKQPGTRSQSLLVRRKCCKTDGVVCVEWRTCLLYVS